MVRLRRPDFQPGNLRDLVSELHSLHARAGWPSTRELAKGQPFSHTTVYELFTKATAPPKLPVLLAVVDRLASAVRGADVETIIDNFDRLWSAAVAAPFTPPAILEDHSAVPSTREEKLKRGRDISDQLTTRQREILVMLISGKSNREVARSLIISDTTLHVHVQIIFKKLGVKTRAEAATLVKSLEMFESGYDYVEEEHQPDSERQSGRDPL